MEATTQPIQETGVLTLSHPQQSTILLARLCSLALANALANADAADADDGCDSSLTFGFWFEACLEVVGKMNAWKGLEMRLGQKQPRNPCTAETQSQNKESRARRKVLMCLVNSSENKREKKTTLLPFFSRSSLLLLL